MNPGIAIMLRENKTHTLIRLLVIMNTYGHPSCVTSRNDTFGCALNVSSTKGCKVVAM